MKIKGWLSCPGLGQPASQVSSLSLRHERPTWELTQSPSPISFPADALADVLRSGSAPRWRLLEMTSPLSYGEHQACTSQAGPTALL